MERLIQAMGERGPGRDRFKTPTFGGVGDVEYFIRQFDEVVEANNWGPPLQDYTSEKLSKSRQKIVAKQRRQRRYLEH